MIRLFVTTILVYSALSSVAQTRSEEGKEIVRKYNNPYAPKISRAHPIEYKLYGYTDSTQLIFTDAANCKMSCLSMDEKRLRAILKNGIVNVSKSELRSNPKKYAVEYQYSGKFYRTVVIPNKKALMVTSVTKPYNKIDCNCEDGKEKVQR